MSAPAAAPGPRFCATCGTARDPAHRFCATCGAGLELPGVTTTGAPPPLDLAALSPIAVLRDRTLWRPPVAAFAAAAIAPFVLVHYGEDPAHFHEVAWGFAVYFAAVWLVVFQALVRPQHVPWAHIAAIAGFTGVAGTALAVWVEERVVGDDPGLLGYVAGVGLPEEGAKLLGVLVVVRLLGASYSPRTYLFLGAVSGLAFGAAEAAGYAVHGAAFASSASDLVVTSVWRLLTGSLFHACMAGITAFFLGLAREQVRHAVPLVLFGLLVAGVLHGVYDDVSQDFTAVLVAAAVVATFVAYAERGEKLAERLGGTWQDPLVAAAAADDA